MSLIFIYKRANINSRSLFCDDLQGVARLVELLKENKGCRGSSDIVSAVTVEGYAKLDEVKKRTLKSNLFFWARQYVCRFA